MRGRSTVGRAPFSHPPSSRRAGLLPVIGVFLGHFHRVTAFVDLLPREAVFLPLHPFHISVEPLSEIATRLSRGPAPHLELLVEDIWPEIERVPGAPKIEGRDVEPRAAAIFMGKKTRSMISPPIAKLVPRFSTPPA
jgi:hypothetical protein